MNDCNIFPHFRFILLIFFSFAIEIAINSQEYQLTNKNTGNTTEFIKREITVIDSILASQNPIRCEVFKDSNLLIVKNIALKDTNFIRFVKNPNSNQNFRTEILSIKPARLGDFPQQLVQQCETGSCYRIEMYNFALNVTTIALASITKNQLLAVNHLKGAQPEINERLKNLSIQIAIHSKEVQEALGYNPTEIDALMASTKTSLNRSKCERSQHLCVSPTFVKNEKALWAIVDLTDLRLVGIRWTTVGQSGPLPVSVITERKLQNNAVTECFCQTINKLDRNDWKMDYNITSSDGLKVSNVFYKGEPIIKDAKLVDWHVNYSNTDGFGYSDAVGCPYFSTAAVIAIEPPQILPIIENGVEVGCILQQNFYSEGWPLPCNYNYCQKFEFYNDGRFRVACASLGRGCGNNGTYRPVIRVSFFNSNHKFYEWKDKNWNQWDKEQYCLQTNITEYLNSKYQFKFNNGNKTFLIEPSYGQFVDGGKGDFAYTYVTKYHEDVDEGDGDLPTIGPCCNTDYRQGPEKFQDPAESINDSPLVFWYVPTIKNDDTKGAEYCWAENKIVNGVYQVQVYPCFAGPMFVPEALIQNQKKL